MSKITKSPKKIAKAAYKAAKASLPCYTHRFSPQKFTQRQLFVCLILKIFFKTDYRGITAILSDSRELRNCFGLKSVPHWTTLHKASKKLLESKVAIRILHNTVYKTDINLAAIDSTGLESSHISRYFVMRKRSKQLEEPENTGRSAVK